jgi:hypothetical protein
MSKYGWLRSGWIICKEQAENQHLKNTPLGEFDEKPSDTLW